MTEIRTQPRDYQHLRLDAPAVREGPLQVRPEHPLRKAALKRLALVIAACGPSALEIPAVSSAEGAYKRRAADNARNRTPPGGRNHLPCPGVVWIPAAVVLKLLGEDRLAVQERELVAVSARDAPHAIPSILAAHAANLPQYLWRV